MMFKKRWPQKSTCCLKLLLRNCCLLSFFLFPYTKTFCWDTRMRKIKRVHFFYKNNYHLLLKNFLLKI